jgi:glycerol-3-phosphate cytidylyltransferase-like family protein
MALTVPLTWVLVIVAVLIIVLPMIVEFVNWALIPFYSTQLFSSLFKNDLILRDDGEKAFLIQGKKKDKDSPLYREKKGFLGFGKIRYLAIDPTNWDKGNGTRFGGSTLRYQYPSKMWLKTLPRMLASEMHLEIAKMPISEAETANNKDAIIRHNKYLHLIAKNNDEQAMKLLRCETKEDIEKYVTEYIVLPADTNKDDKALIEKIKADIVKEVQWVQEYCSNLPRECNLSQMMKAYPDNETNYGVIANIRTDCEEDAKATSQFNPMQMLLIVGGIVLISGIIEIITIVILA